MRYVVWDQASLGAPEKSIRAVSVCFMDGSCTCLVNRPKNILPDIDECVHMKLSSA